MKSRHQKEVATEDKHLTEQLCRDIWMQSRISTESEAVATAVCRETKVATSVALKRRSRQDQVVATSIAKTSGRDIMKKSRQQEQETKVTTTPGFCDNSCKD